ncbi:MAG: CvpA family protein [Fluviicola sp.]|nr:CvpA family protein [Fluviicola sp.]
MGFLDIAFAFAIAYGAWKGFKKGFVIELFTFLALFLALYAGIHFSDFMAEILTENFKFTSEYIPTISFTVIFLLVGAMVYFAGIAIEKVVKVVQLSLLNKILGIVLGILKMVFILGAITLLIESYDEKGDFVSEEAKDNSIFYQPLKTAVTFAIPAFEESTLFLKNTLVEGIEDVEK